MRAASALWIDKRDAHQATDFNRTSARSSENARTAYSILSLRSEQCKWRKTNNECTPTQTASVVCCTLEAVDTECRSPRAGHSNRAKKL